VVVAALDGTYQRQGFGNILQLVPLAESVEKLNAVCMMCFESASYTKRIGNEEEVGITL
jgi:thymidine kinase